jgi:large subunit ribosomal protein L23
MKFPFFKKKWGEKKTEKSSASQTSEDKEKTIELNKVETINVVPLITEKNLNLSKENIYVFKASNNFNKNQLKKIISEMFNVDVVKIRTINYSKRVRGRSKLKNVRPKFKKVLVKLAAGQKISIFE